MAQGNATLKGAATGATTLWVMVSSALYAAFGEWLGAFALAFSPLGMAVGGTLGWALARRTGSRPSDGPLWAAQAVMGGLAGLAAGAYFAIRLADRSNGLSILALIVGGAVGALAGGKAASIADSSDRLQWAIHVGFQAVLAPGLALAARQFAMTLN